jgi:hypothetical protein
MAKRRRRRLTTSGQGNVSVALSDLGKAVIAAAAKSAMYSQGYPGHPPAPANQPITIKMTIPGEDAQSLSQIDGSTFVAPPIPPAQRKRRSV